MLTETQLVSIQPALRRMAWKFATSCNMDVEDLTQEAALRLWDKRETFDHEPALAWTHFHAGHLFLDLARRRTTERECLKAVAVSFRNPTPTPEDYCLAEEVSRMYSAAAARKSPNTRARLRKAVREALA